MYSAAFPAVTTPAGNATLATVRSRRDHRSCSYLIVLSLALLGGCVAPTVVVPDSAAGYLPAVPRGFEPPVVPDDNPLTAAKVELGRALFHDVRLSRTGDYSCASCHDPPRFFTDGRPRAVGALGEVLPFNTPTLLNSAYASSLGWAAPGHGSLEEQHMVPLRSTTPVELGATTTQLARLWADDRTRALVVEAFGPVPTLTFELVAASLASYMRTLLRGGGALDRYLFDGDSAVLSEAERRGLALFLSPRLNCSSCHRGVLLSGPTTTTASVAAPSFYRTGVGNSSQRFRTPALRFLRHTAPYMHDGSLPTLASVVAFYEAGGGAGAERLQPFVLNADERAQLLAFLRVL